jgi:hypothetical protein
MQRIWLMLTSYIGEGQGILASLSFGVFLLGWLSKSPVVRKVIIS